MAATSILVAALLLGALGLRFWRLDADALWGDEIVTILLALGHRLSSLPLDRVWDVATVEQVLRLDAPAGFGAIADAVRSESTHPPLFTYLMHLWLRLAWSGHWPDLAWSARALAAGIGALGVAVLGVAGAVAVPSDRRRAVATAMALAALSPMAVYQAQQARYYSLAVLVLALGLVGHLLVLRELSAGRAPRLAALALWGAAGAIGFYVQYLLVLAWAGQVLVTAWWLWRHRRPGAPRGGRVAATVAATVLAWLPWLSTVLAHSGRPEVAWVRRSWSWTQAALDVLCMIPGALWVFAGAPLRDGATAAAGAVILAIVAALAGLAWVTVRRLPAMTPRADVLRATLGQAAATTALLLAVGWWTATGLTEAIRYFLLVLPPLVIAATAWIGAFERRVRAGVLAVVLAAGLAGSALAVSGMLYPQPREPGRTAHRMLRADAHPALLVWTYAHLNDVSAGLALGLQLMTLDGRARVQLVSRPQPLARETVAALRKPVDVWANRALDDPQLAAAGCRPAAEPRLRVQGKSLYHVVCE